MGMEIFISVVLLLIGIAVLVIIHVCIVGRAFNRNNNGNGNGGTILVQRNMNRSSSMSQDDIKKLPSFDYEDEKEKEKGISSSSSHGSPLGLLECAVCLENFRGGEKCRLLPKCNHSFHAECIDSWLLKTAVCPICRTETISQTVGGHGRDQIEVGVELA
ncbi:hypothetical protein M9H77_04699 [Catharanthus roseus]|uniref:Uncharacterized protein n=1 Tax=Catharanthus roseus TaxID=4058 RepID=A0ACC0CFD1_CATRO|nr:hypothetical protein M9H77_04699 [Catharanthus roseus]